MIKKMTIILMTLFVSTAYAQTVEEQIKELNTKIQSFEQRLNEIEEINETLKQNYELFQGEHMTRVEDVEIKFISAIGDKYQKKITVTLLVNNLGQTRRTEVSEAFITDEYGTEFKAETIKFGSDKNWYWILTHSDSPTQVKMTFENIGSNPNYIRKLNFGISLADPAERGVVSIDGTQINWN